MYRGTKIMLVVTLTIIFMVSIWAVDVSSSALLNEGRLFGLFGDVSPAVIYHLGMLLAIGSFLTLAFLTVNEIIKE